MKTPFPKVLYHVPRWFLIDAADQILGRIATRVIGLLRGKYTSYFVPGFDQGNFVIVLNADKIRITGLKATNKYYYRPSLRPGTLKKETLSIIKARNPAKILEYAVKGMLPKTSQGRFQYRRLHLYTSSLTMAKFL